MTKKQQQLVTENHGLIYYVLNRRGLVGDKELFCRDEDWYGIAAEALCKAAINFDESLGNKFSTVAVTYINKAISQKMQTANAYYRIESKGVVSSYNEQIPSDFGEGIELWEALESDDNVEKTILDRIFIKQLLSGLDERESYIVRSIASGYTERELGEEMGISAARVGHIYNRAVDKAYMMKRGEKLHERYWKYGGKCKCYQ